MLLAENRAVASISIALVDNDTIHRLNRLHLGHDWPTDVITFPLSDPDEPALSGRAGHLDRDGRRDGPRDGRSSHATSLRSISSTGCCISAGTTIRTKPRRPR